MLESYRSEQPSPSRPILLSGAVLRYYGYTSLTTLPVSDSLSHPVVRDWRSSQGGSGV
jgi:hypothetical protein